MHILRVNSELINGDDTDLNHKSDILNTFLTRKWLKCTDIKNYHKILTVGSCKFNKTGLKLYLVNPKHDVNTLT